MGLSLRWRWGGDGFRWAGGAGSCPRGEGGEERRRLVNSGSLCSGKFAKFLRIYCKKEDIFADWG